MALNYPTNPPQVILLAHLIDFEGKAKSNVTAATVRVFHINGGVEVIDLAPTSLVRVGASSAWRYVWVSPPLATAGAFVVEYTSTDADGIVASESEDLLVEDSSTTAAALQTSLDDLLDGLLGEQILDALANTFTMKRRNGNVLKVFDTKDDVGMPSVSEIFRRIPR
jgi:hypothetical protein